ncbi:hypothetical protein ACQP2Y_09125 [Actinoplanes sp. CA-051413]|uniref:hypothetical protein n=1 Tax=Actinoplanes sp. CA-051413 TaxID=3239899 RepID=UPI003D97CB08
MSVALLVPEWIRVRRSTIAMVPSTLPTVHSTEAGSELVQLPYSGTRSGSELAVVWNAVDNALPTSPAKCSFSPQQRQLPGRISRLAHEILTLRAKSQNTFNGKLVRQDDDLDGDLLMDGGTVRLSRTDYFSMMCSNYLTGWQVLDRQTGSELVDGGKLIIRDGKIIPLTDSWQANAIGVSTLAFTSDGKLVLTLQGARSASEPGLFAPAGSGSVDLRDVKRHRGGQRALVEFLACAMQRELVEESNIRYHDIAWTEVLGYFRWLNKGAKPEYVGVTLLKLSADELFGRDVRLVETPFVQRLEFDGKLDLAELRRDPASLLALEDRFRDQVSMPLYMGLRALGRALGRGDEMALRLSALTPL